MSGSITVLGVVEYREFTLPIAYLYILDQTQIPIPGRLQNRCHIFINHILCQGNWHILKFHLQKSNFAFLPVLLYVAISTSPTVYTTQSEYIPRGRNVLHSIFENHFQDFVDHYEEKYEKDYGKYRLDRIISVVKNFLDCGDYMKGIARIWCLNPEYGYDFFVPFSCKGFYLCPSCSQKRTLLFSENMVNDVILLLPHRQYVFAIPKCLRLFFKHDRKLFGEVSRLIFQMIQSFYNEAAGKTIRTASVISFQTAGDFLKVQFPLSRYRFRGWF